MVRWYVTGDVPSIPECSDPNLTGSDLLDFLREYPKTSFGEEDCDGGSVSNIDELNQGANPLTNPDDDLDPPIPCAKGLERHTIYHLDGTNSYLSGGNLVTTTLTGSGNVQPSNASALNSAFVNTPNNIVNGGSLIYKSNDGDSGSVNYEFCSPVTNPYIYIGSTGPEPNTRIEVFEGDGITPIPLQYL